MTGIAGLLTSKKGSLVLIAALLMTLVDPTVAEFLPKLSDTHIVCLTVIVGVAIVCQTVLDALDRIKPPTNGA